MWAPGHGWLGLYSYRQPGLRLRQRPPGRRALRPARSDRRRLWMLLLILVLGLLLQPWVTLPVLPPFRSPAVTSERSGHPGPAGPTLTLWDVKEQELLELPLEEYLVGVVAAEMPAQFPLEALKAQAIAARTFALRALVSGVKIPEAPRASLSSDFRTGQAWQSQEELKKKWGFLLYQWNICRIRKAVSETRGVVIIHDGQLIFPAFHSTSGGRTEDSENYWATALPYLRSVESPYEEDSPYWRTTVTIPIASALARLSASSPHASGSAGTGTGRGAAVGSGTVRVQVVGRYPSGRVRLLQLNGHYYTGREVREALGLPSSWFEVEAQGSILRFEVRGYGHGVGLSQYGAAGMARRGANFQQILTHYYQGVTLARAY